MNYRIISTDFNRKWFLSCILALSISFMAACKEEPAQPETPAIPFNPQSEEIRLNPERAYLAMVAAAKTPAIQQEIKVGLKQLNISDSDVVGNVVSVFVGDPQRVVVLYPGIHREAGVQKAQIATVAKLLASNKIERVLFEGVSSEIVFKPSGSDEISLADYVSMVVTEPINVRQNPRELSRLGQRYPGVPLVYWLTMYDEALVHGVDVHSQIREEMEEQNNNHYIVNVRDQIMAANTERIINSGVSRLAFPVGVAHADGLTKIFRDKKISYVLIDHPAVSATLRKLHQGGEVNAKNVQIRRMLKGVKKDIESIFVEVQRSPISNTKPIFKYISDMEDGLFGGGC